MVVFNAERATSLSPPEHVRLFLLYGTDSGLVYERTREIASCLCPGDDPFSLIKMDDKSLAATPGALQEEVFAYSLFSEKRVIWITYTAASHLPTLLRPLLAEKSPLPTPILIEAGALKRRAPLRVLLEKEKKAWVIPCYPDQAAEIAALITCVLQTHGQTITPEGRKALQARLGSNRLTSRQELEKLCLYTLDQKQITREDVEMLVGDTTLFMLDALIDAALTGDIMATRHKLRQFFSSDMSHGFLTTQLLRHLQFLQGARAKFDRGLSSKRLVESACPPLYFARHSIVMQQIQHWTPQRLTKALTLTQMTILKTRQTPAIASELIERLLNRLMP